MLQRFHLSVITKTRCFWFIRHLDSFHSSHFKNISGRKLKVTNVKYILINYCLHYMLLKSWRGLGLIINPFCNITKKNLRYYISKMPSSGFLQRVLQRNSFPVSEERATSSFTVTEFGSCHCRSTWTNFGHPEGVGSTLIPNVGRTLHRTVFKPRRLSFQKRRSEDPITYIVCCSLFPSLR
jgi:hypothetical protein